jgi:hypothetical protein
MPRPPPDHRTMPPRHRAARVSPALQHPPASPITGSATTRRRHPARLKHGNPRPPTRPTRRPRPRIPVA